MAKATGDKKNAPRNNKTQPPAGKGNTKGAAELPAVITTAADDAIVPEVLPSMEEQEAMIPRRYSISEKELTDKLAKYAGLKIDLDNPESVALVKAARADVVETRTTIEKKRKELKEPAKHYGEMVDAHAKKLQALIAPIEEAIMLEYDQWKKQEEEKENRRKMGH